MKSTSVEQLIGGSGLDIPFETKVLPLIKDHPEWWPLSVQNVESFKYCGSLVMSRGFHDEVAGGPYILPGIDLLNHHSQECQTTMEWSPSDRVFRIKTARFVGEGEQRMVSIV